jgi:hypothetical protein
VDIYSLLLRYFYGLMLAVSAVVLGDAMSFEEALALASRDESFKATVYAMNTLLIGKGIYTREEFESLFVEWVRKEQQRARPRSQTQDSMPCPA